MPSNDLLKVQLDILPHFFCQRAYEDEDFEINGKQICSGILAGGFDTCQGNQSFSLKLSICHLFFFCFFFLSQGDSGGPLQILLPDNKCVYSVLGVTSFGPASCGFKNSPSVYTRVSSYLDWIESIVWQ